MARLLRLHQSMRHFSVRSDFVPVMVVVIFSLWWWRHPGQVFVLLRSGGVLRVSVGPVSVFWRLPNA